MQINEASYHSLEHGIKCDIDKSRNDWLLATENGIKFRMTFCYCSAAQHSASVWIEWKSPMHTQSKIQCCWQPPNWYVYFIISPADSCWSRIRIPSNCCLFLMIQLQHTLTYMYKYIFSISICNCTSESASICMIVHVCVCVCVRSYSDWLAQRNLATYITYILSDNMKYGNRRQRSADSTSSRESTHTLYILYQVYTWTDTRPAQLGTKILRKKVREKRNGWQRGEDEEKEKKNKILG